MSEITERLKSTEQLIPGTLLAGTIALAATFLNEHYGGPTMLYALLFGMAFNFLIEDQKIERGIEFVSTQILRIGVALLGFRITISDLESLGIETAAIVIAGVAITIIAGSWISRRYGLSAQFSILSAGAVAICGASAALAISSILPKDKSLESNTLITVAAVTTLSTISMIIYPVFVTSIGMAPHQAGIFLGSTIHDVAQVVGAGYTISDDAGDTAAIVKLLRVACLLPVVILIGAHYRAKSGAENGLKPKAPFPWFLIAFIIIVIINSANATPLIVNNLAGDVSKWALASAVAALGVKTSMAKLAAVGAKPLIAICLQTLLLAAFSFATIELALT